MALRDSKLVPVFPEKPGSSHAPDLKGGFSLPTVSGAPGDHGIAQLEKGRFVAVLLGGGKEMEPDETQTPNPDIKDERKPGKKPTESSGLWGGVTHQFQSLLQEEDESSAAIGIHFIHWLKGKKKATWCFQKTLCQSVQPGRE